MKLCYLQVIPSSPCRNAFKWAKTLWMRNNNCKQLSSSFEWVLVPGEGFLQVFWPNNIWEKQLHSLFATLVHYFFLEVMNRSTRRGPILVARTQGNLSVRRAAVFQPLPTRFLLERRALCKQTGRLKQNSQMLQGKLAHSAWTRDTESRSSKWFLSLLRIQVPASFTSTQHYQDCQAFNLNY